MPRSSPSSVEQSAAAVELNHAEWVRLEGLVPWAKLNEEHDVMRIFAGDTWPANTVVLARFTANSAHRRVGEVLAPHLKAKAACNWVVGPASQPADLGTHLRAHGFSCRIHCAGMVCDLARLAPTPPLPDGAAVDETNEPTTLEPLTTERRRRQHEGALAAVRLRPRRVWHFAARFREKTVGHATLVTGAGVGGIYAVHVVEAMRRQGLGTALVHAALVQAKRLGLPAAVLSATGAGQGVYERTGFREVCKMSFWKYGKMRQLGLDSKPGLRALLAALKTPR